MRGRPPRAFHGAKDDFVPLSETVALVRAWEDCGGNVRLTVYPEAEHDCWTQTYENRELFEWLLSHRRRSRTENR